MACPHEAFAGQSVKDCFDIDEGVGGELANTGAHTSCWAAEGVKGRPMIAFGQAGPSASTPTTEWKGIG